MDDQSHRLAQSGRDRYHRSSSLSLRIELTESPPFARAHDLPSSPLSFLHHLLLHLSHFQENVHLSTRNLYTLHTSSGCSLPPPGPHRRQTGKAKTNNCDVNAAGQWSNEGCGVESSDDRTWGKGFNEDGGGIVVMKWTDEGISIWQFRKGTEPLDLSTEGEEVDPETWEL